MEIYDTITKNTVLLKVTEQLIYVYAQLTQTNLNQKYERLSYKGAKYCH